MNAGDSVEPARALAVLQERGHTVIVSEAGPTLFGSLLAANAVDELLLTVSPLVAGRARSPRLSLVEGVEFLPDVRVEAAPLSIRRHGGHLFLRYSLRSGPDHVAGVP